MEKSFVERHVLKIIGLVVLVILFFIVWPFKIVQSSEVGLRFRLGAIQNEVLEQGIHFKIPLVDKIKTVPLQPIQLDHKVHVGEDGAITKDNQTVGADLTVFYAYRKDSVVQMWQQYGEQKIADVIAATLKETFKGAIGTRDIFSLANTQAETQKEVFAALREKLKDYPVEIREMKITNYDWSCDFDAQIKTTMVRAQQVKQAEQDLLLTEQTANKKVKEAEAEKNALITQAQGEKEAAALRAEAKALEGEGIKKYNESIQKNMELELKLRQLEIDKIRAEKWNGKEQADNNYGPIPVQFGPSALGQ